VPAGTAENAFELLDNLAVAANGPIEPLQVAVDDEDQIVEIFATRERNRTERFRLVRFAVAHEGPDLAVRCLGQLVVLKVLQEPRLIDRHQRSQPHRHRRELPEIRHQPWMRIARQALAAGLLPETEKLLLAQASFEKGARIDAGRAVSLHEDQIAAMAIRRCMPEVAEADIIERGSRL